jgi:glycosyltransferase involved in cell wall biosynthesis
VAAADVFVLACTDERPRWHMDGIPVALMEAMALERAVVSTRISGIPELVEDGRSGVLVPEKDPEALAAALEGLLRDEAKRAALGRAARDKVAREYDLAANTRQLAELFARETGP